MIRPLILAAAIAIPAIGHANGADEACFSLGELATTIMTGRQNGVPMAEMIRAAATADDEGAAEVARAMVMDAYNMPRWISEENKIRAAQDFGNDVTAYCLMIADGEAA